VAQRVALDDNGQVTGHRPAAAEQPSRILLRGGLVADAIAETTRRADLLIDGPVIAGIGAGLATGPGFDVIDLAAGSVICPGFIDAHVHAEGPLLATGRVEGALAQGVTTLVVGQDGQSWIGANAATAGYLNDYFAPVNGHLEPARELSVAGYHEAVRGRLAHNVAVLASQGTIRHNVAALSPGPLDPAQRRAARRELEAALSDGAVGLSSGMDYLPSRFGGVDEVADLARPLADAGRPYVSHLRGYGPDVAAGLDELIAVGRQAGVALHASHLWGPVREIERAFRTADAAQVPVSFDMYPYRKSSTILAMLLLPPELQAGGPSRTMAALRDRRERTALLTGQKLSGDFLRDVYLGCLPAGLADLAGLSVAQAAARSGCAPDSYGEWTLDLLASSGLNVGGHLDRPALAGRQLAWLADHPRFCAGSDGIYQGQHPHPRGYGTFARLAAHYLTGGPERGYQRLARHLAANPADAYGLTRRGRLARGLAADLCVIGPERLRETATYAAPTTPATGVSLVIVNGVIAYRDARPVPSACPGQLVT
jgi:N-acyl-D-amino-acid deacylase